MQDDLPESGEMATKMGGSEQLGIKAIVRRGGSQGKVSTRFLNSAMLNTAGAHCTWQGSFVKASGEFHIKPRYLPGVNVPIQLFLQVKLRKERKQQLKKSWGNLYDLHVCACWGLLGLQFLSEVRSPEKKMLDFSFNPTSCRETEEADESMNSAIC